MTEAPTEPFVSYGGPGRGYHVARMVTRNGVRERVTIAGPYTSREQAETRRDTIVANERGELPRLTMTYGPQGQYLVEFKLGGVGSVMGRYLPSPDGRGRQTPTEWETRDPDATDADHCAVIAAIHTLLTAYGLGEDS